MKKFSHQILLCVASVCVLLSGVCFTWAGMTGKTARAAVIVAPALGFNVDPIGNTIWFSGGYTAANVDYWVRSVYFFNDATNRFVKQNSDDTRYKVRDPNSKFSFERPFNVKYPGYCYNQSPASQSRIYVLAFSEADTMYGWGQASMLSLVVLNEYDNSDPTSQLSTITGTNLWNDGYTQASLLGGLKYLSEGDYADVAVVLEAVQAELATANAALATAQEKAGLWSGLLEKLDLDESTANVQTVMDYIDSQKTVAAASAATAKEAEIWALIAEELGEYETIEQLKNYAAQIEGELATATAQIETLNGRIADLNAQIAALEDQIAERDVLIAELRAQLAGGNNNKGGGNELLVGLGAAAGGIGLGAGAMAAVMFVRKRRGVATISGAEPTAREVSTPPEPTIEKPKVAKAPAKAKKVSAAPDEVTAPAKPAAAPARKPASRTKKS